MTKSVTPANTFDALTSGKRVHWSELDEQGKYDAWSFYYKRTRAPYAYVPFCNFMDHVTSSEQPYVLVA